jgi:hypothetical protein
MGMIRTAQEVVKMKKKYASGMLLSAALLMMPVTGFASQEGMFEFLPAAAIEAIQQANEDGSRQRKSSNRRARQTLRRRRFCRRLRKRRRVPRQL